MLAAVNDTNLLPIDRILGQSTRLLQRVVLLEHSNIRAEYFSVYYDENLPEEHAKLNLFPVNDNEYCIQLSYIRFDSNSDTAKVYWIEFKPGFFEQYPISLINSEKPFKLDKITEQQFSICTQSLALLEQLEEADTQTSFTFSLRTTEIITHLLRRALECIQVPFTVCPVPACRFLAYDTEREKIIEAQTILNQRFDNTVTIKELSRMVAMNECYLKKGFKAMTGKTIHEYTHELRIIKAKEMLQLQGLSVSEVSNTLGFSSISHFSTAFKKATGMKPCELLS
ncbi:MAG: helix-turn-helix transcriptional regulator [Bacteroidetes bacterium]|nr:helix-turn-helix transcriptional regulator [Bacteroidota bacterium]